MSYHLILATLLIRAQYPLFLMTSFQSNFLQTKWSLHHLISVDSSTVSVFVDTLGEFDKYWHVSQNQKEIQITIWWWDQQACLSICSYFGWVRQIQNTNREKINNSRWEEEQPLLRNFSPMLRFLLNRGLWMRWLDWNYLFSVYFSAYLKFET